MTRAKPEPVQVIKQRRDTALRTLVGGVPYIGFLGIGFDRRGDELTALLPFDPKLIGNPLLPALHGGATAAFLEVTAIIELAWSWLWEDMEKGALDPRAIDPAHLPQLPKTIDFTVDYLRSGLPRCLCTGPRQPLGAALCQRPCRGLAGQPRPPVRPGHRAFPDARARSAKVIMSGAGYHPAR